MTLFVSILIFILGSAIGSFLSVIIYRIKNKKDGIFFGRSVCVYTGKTLKWYHLIPIWSWIFLRGKSPYTDKPISVHYLLLEIITGLAFLTGFLKWNFLISTPLLSDANLFTHAINWTLFFTLAFHLTIFSFLILIFFYDLLYQEIPDRFSLPAIAIAIIGLLTLQTPTISSALTGSLSVGGFFLLQYVISGGKIIGGGDIRLGALMGAYLGFSHGLLALVLSYIIGSIITIVMMMAKKIKLKSKVAFGPFLVTGTFITVFYGDKIINWYLQSLGI